jgi:hypothetical protein
MTVATAVARLQTIAGAVSGVNVAATLPPESLAQFPVAISYVSDCLLGARYTGAHAHSQWVLTTEIHVSRKDLPRDYAALDGLGALFVAAVRLDSRSNTAGSLGVIASAIGDQSGQVVATNWGDANTLAWFCRVPFKIQQ